MPTPSTRLGLPIPEGRDNHNLSNFQNLIKDIDAKVAKKTDVDVLRSEINVARGGATTLGDRLDSEKAEVIAQLQQIVTINAEQMIELEGGDVTKGLQRTINEAISLNKARVLWSGVYKIDSTLVIERTNEDNNTQIVFFGGGQLKKADSFTGDRLLNIKIGFHDEDNISFENISFQGVDRTINGIDTFRDTVPFNQDGEVSSDGHQTKFVSFRNCTFHGFYRAIRLSSLQYNFYSCLFQHNIYGGFLNMAANNNSFFACQFRRNIVGIHLKQLNSSYGTVNNVFFNCIFESNNNAGIINENAALTGLFGGYFENNCWKVDTDYIYPEKKCNIQFIGWGSSGGFNMRGVFFWDNNVEYTLYGDDMSGVTIRDCGEITINAGVITGRVDTDISNITVRNTDYDSNILIGNTSYTFTKGVKYKTADYTTVINQKKSIIKSAPAVVGNNPKITLANLKINNTSNAKIKICAYLIGETASGNPSLEGFIEREFTLGKKTTNEINSYNVAPLKDSVRGYAASDSGAGGKTGNLISGSSDIVLDKVNDTTQSISITNLINPSVINWGYANKYRAKIVVDIEGANLGGYIKNDYTEEIIELT